MTITNEEKDLILEILFRYLDPKECEVWLFGSQATGKSRKNSDIDIAIKSKQKLDLVKWQLIESELEESTELHKKVDVVDYHRVQEEFQEVIDTTGQKWL